MRGKGERIHLSLTLEGTDVPVIGAAVQCGVNIDSTANILIPYSMQGLDIKPRTLTHLFFKDRRGVDRLLFSGDDIGIAPGKTTKSRSMTLVCSGHTSYYAQAKKYYYDELSFDAEKVMRSTFVGASGRLQHADVLSSTADTLANLLMQRPDSYPNIGGVLGGIIKIFETIGGYYYGGEKKKGINDFFSISQLRLKLVEQIGAAEKDTTSMSLLKSKEFKKWLRSIINRGGDIASVQDVMQVLLMRIFYNMVSNPAAYYKTQEAIKILTGTTYQLPIDIQEKMNKSRDYLVKLKNGLHDIVETPPFGIFQHAFYSDFESKAFPTNIQKDFKNAKQFAKSIENGFGETLFNIPDNTRAAQENLLLNYIDTLIGIYKRLERNYGTGKSWTKRQVRPDTWMLTTLLFPDIFFCPPPACNVIFPEQYEMIDGSINFLDSPTRLLLSTDGVWAGTPSLSDIGFSDKQSYFAPDIQDIYGKSMSLKAARSTQFILPHEKFTGIQADIEWMPDIREFDPVLEEEGGSVLADISEETERARGVYDNIPYMQRMANFTFFQRRFANRKGRLRMKFNPYLVPGMPCLIVDKYAVDTHRPDQYMAVPLIITHNIFKGEAYTTVELGYLRRHSEGEEFVPKKAWVTDKSKRKVYINTYGLNDEVVPQRGGTIDEKNVWTDLSDKNIFALPVSQPAATTEDAIAYEHTELCIQSITLHEGIKKKVQSVTTLGDAKKFAKETVYGRKQIDVALEDVIRPAWFSPIFCNHSIGKDFYEPLIGVRSVIDKFQEAEALANLEDIEQAPDQEQLSKVLDRALEGTKKFSKGKPLREVIDELIKYYSDIREGIDVNMADFIDDFTERAIATREQVLGTKDLRYDVSGEPNEKAKEGFHSRAFAHSAEVKAQELSFGVDGTKPDEVSIGQTTVTTWVNPNLGIGMEADPRIDRKRAIQEYVASLKHKDTFKG